MRIILIGCGKQKLDEPAAAADLYTGPLFRARRTYAEKSNCSWFIVSAKFGLVRPEVVLQPYDATPPTRRLLRAAWAVGVVAQLLDELPEDCDLRETFVELHAGELYCDPLEAVLRSIGIGTHWATRGFAIGEQLKFYRSHRRLRYAV